MNDITRLKLYFRSLLVVAFIVLLYALYVQYIVRRTSAVLDAGKERISMLRHELDSTAALTTYLQAVNGDIVASNIALKAESEVTLRALSSEIFGLKSGQERIVKRVADLTKVSQVVKVDSVYIPYDTSYKPFKVDSIAVPKRFVISDSSKHISGYVFKGGAIITSLEIPDSLYLRSVLERKGLGRVWAVQALHTSPYMRTSGIAQIRLKQKPTRWQRWIKPALVGALSASATYYILKH